MLIKEDTCIGCGQCFFYCPVEAIYPGSRQTPKGQEVRAVDLDRCVECGACLRAKVCAVDAIYQQPLEWPRTLRAAFSSPLTEHKQTRNLGRGTEEMKTNEVTHRFVRGQVGVAVEMGRPGVGTSLRDIERVTEAMARLGVEFESDTPVTGLMSDRQKGTLQPEVLGEQLLSAIIEFKISEGNLETILAGLDNVAKTIESVFSLGIISVLPSEGRDPILARLEKFGCRVRPNGKVNLGLGRPLASTQ
jgi:NAD-dependent dihydropyrimidine dehydrogenase PreA subunit